MPLFSSDPPPTEQVRPQAMRFQKLRYNKPMSQAYIVIFQSSNHKDALVAKIKSFNGYAKLTEGSWIITSPQEAVEIRDELYKTAPGAKVIVIRSSAVAAWANVPQKTGAWLKKHL